MMFGGDLQVDPHTRVRGVGESKMERHLGNGLKEREFYAPWEAQSVIDRLLEMWEQKHERTLPLRFRPKVEWSQRRLRRRRGLANYRLGLITLYPAGQTLGTLVHEVAHFIAAAVSRDYRHGDGFKRAHLELLVMVQKHEAEFLQQSADPMAEFKPVYTGGDGLQLVLQMA